jgi:hypothetical protein
MFGMLESLAKATIGVAINTPMAILADVVTLGGVVNDRRTPYTVDALKDVVENLEQTVKPK